MQPQAEAARLDAVFYALSDARRREMIDRLSAGPASVKAIAEPIEMGLPSAVKHLGVLEDARLVESEKTGRVRTYRLVDHALTEVETWVNARRKAVHRQLDRLEEYLAATKPETER